MAKKQKLAVKTPENQPPAETSTPFLAPVSELNPHADLLNRVSVLEERLSLQKAQLGDFRVAVVCVLKCIQGVENKFGMRFMPKGEFYGIKFE